MTGTSEVCRNCGKLLPEGKRPNQVYCDESCHRIDLKKQWKAQNPKSPLAAYAAGTVAEANVLAVSLDLLKRGYAVYRAAFPAMPFDIIMVPVFGKSSGPQRRVKVTSGSRTPKGTVTYSVKSREHDVVAVVLGDGSVVYKPEVGHE